MSYILNLYLSFLKVHSDFSQFSHLKPSPVVFYGHLDLLNLLGSALRSDYRNRTATILYNLNSLCQKAKFVKK